MKSRGERTCAALVDRIEAEYFIYPPATHTHTYTRTHANTSTQTDEERAGKTRLEKQSKRNAKNALRKRIKKN